MKVSYSKIILGGIIASTFLMVSCQKKGNVRGIGPQAVQKSDSKNSPTQNENAEVDSEVENQNPDQPVPENNTVAQDPVSKKTNPGDQLDAKIKEELKKMTPLADENEKDKSENKDQTTQLAKTPVKPVEQKPVVISEKDKKAETSVNPIRKLDEGCECPQNIINYGLSTMVKQKNIIMNLAQSGQLTPELKIEKLTQYLNSCTEWENLFKKEYISTCKIKELTLTPKSFDRYCSAYEKNLAFDKFKKEKLVISEEANKLFFKENQAWKNYLVDGEVQTDMRKLADFVDQGKVACTFQSSAEKTIDLSKNTFTVLGYKKSTQVISNVEVKNIIEFNLILNTDKKDDKPSTTSFSISCANLKVLDVNLVKQALGSVLKSDAESKLIQNKDQALVK